jgi:uncharacterized membrane protein YeaQ/YmgE (transglycosylase-associated protein family)
MAIATLNVRAEAMEGVGWLGAIIIGGIAGWIAEKLMHANIGIVMNIILGIVGALVLNAILYALNVIPPGGWFWQLIIAVVGACLLIWGYRAIRGNRRTI